jgi:hydrogenase nickel incorporation protein HypB
LKKGVVKAEEGEIYDVELSEDLLKANQRLAEENRRLLHENGAKAIDIMGAIGSGKTSLIEKLVRLLKDRYRIAVFKGDLTTTIDAELIARHGVDTVAINTGKECHLDANLVRKALQKLNLKIINLLLIENVGNLICPAEFPLGSDKRVVVISVTEGPYMVVKHPFIFMEADVVAINKTDLAKPMGVDAKKLEKDVKTINPEITVVATNCRTGEGIEGVAKALGL